MMKVYKAKNYFSSDFEFAVRHEKNTSDKFNAYHRFKREFWKITYIVKGCGKVIINDRSYPVRDGSIYLVHPDSETTYDMDVPEMELYNVIFSNNFIENELLSLRDAYQFFTIFSPSFKPEGSAAVYVQKSTPRIKRQFLEIVEEYEMKKLNYKEYLKFSLALLLIQMLRESGRTFHEKGAKEMLGYINHIMNADLFADTGASRLAKVFGITPNHLCALYKKAAGTTLSQARIKARLNAAAALLETSSLPIHDICFKCGFNDLSYFYRVFKKHCGKSPRSFRKTGQD